VSVGGTGVSVGGAGFVGGTGVFVAVAVSVGSNGVAVLVVVGVFVGVFVGVNVGVRVGTEVFVAAGVNVGCTSITVGCCTRADSPASLRTTLTTAQLREELIKRKAMLKTIQVLAADLIAL